MPSTVPCAVCETEQVHTLSEYLLKALTDQDDIPEGTTLWVCKGCLTRVVLSWYAEPEPEGPGVLEQIEADEGEVRPASANGRGRKSRQEKAGADAEDVPQEAASADVAE